MNPLSINYHSKLCNYNNQLGGQAIQPILEYSEWTSVQAERHWVGESFKQWPIARILMIIFLFFFLSYIASIDGLQIDLLVQQWMWCFVIIIVNYVNAYLL